MVVTDQPNIGGVVSYRDAAESVLREFARGEPLHYREITRLAIEKGLITPGGPTPEATMSAALSTDVKGIRVGGTGKRFKSYGKGLYGLAAPSSAAHDSVDIHNTKVRRRLRDLLADMDPKAFENLMGQLFVALGFEDVEVTKYSGDGGIDVRGRLAVGGVTNVQTAIQVKRWANNVPDRVVRELRGGLSTQERGLVITLSDFTAAARKEAAKADRVPISLINGERLITLLVENNIGVVTKNVSVLEIDEAALDSVEDGGGKPSGNDAIARNLTLWPLPGGRGMWKEMLIRMLKFVSGEKPTLKEAIDWLIESIAAVNSEKTARSYWIVPKSMGLIEVSGEQLDLTRSGASYVASQDDTELFTSLQSNIAGIQELIDALDEGTKTEDELLQHLRKVLGVAWETPTQVFYRCAWLEELGRAKKTQGKWMLTKHNQHTRHGSSTD